MNYKELHPGDIFRAADGKVYLKLEGTGSWDFDRTPDTNYWKEKVLLRPVEYIGVISEDFTAIKSKEYKRMKGDKS